MRYQHIFATNKVRLAVAYLAETQENTEQLVDEHLDCVLKSAARVWLGFGCRTLRERIQQYMTGIASKSQETEDEGTGNRAYRSYAEAQPATTSVITPKNFSTIKTC